MRSVNPVNEERFKAAHYRSPAWRWNIARQCVLDPAVRLYEVLETAKAAEDIWLYEACKMYTSMSKMTTIDPVLVSRHAPMYEAYIISKGNHQGPDLRWVAEALLCTAEGTDEAVAAVLRCTHGTATIEMFRKVFFDIEHYKNDPELMLCVILAQAERASGDPAHDSDYTWKCLAMNMGFDMFRAFMRFRGSGIMEDHIQAYLSKVTTARKIYAGCETVMKLKDAFNPERLPFMEHVNHHVAAVKAINEEDVGDISTLKDACVSAFFERVQLDVEKGLLPRSGPIPFFERGVSDKFLPDASLRDRLNNKTQPLL